MTLRALIGACLVGSFLLLAGCGGAKSGVPTPGGVPTPAASGSAAGSAGGSGSATSSTSGGTAAGAGSAAKTGASTSGGSTTAATGAGSATPASKVEVPKYEPVKLGPLAPAAEAVMGPLSIKLGLMEARSAGTQAPGFEYFFIQVTVKNTGPIPYGIDPVSMLALTDPKGKVLKVDPKATNLKTERLDVTVGPGQTVVGWIGFVAKLDDGNYKLVITPPNLGEAVYQFEAPPM